MKRPCRFAPGKETHYPLYRRLGGAPGLVWMGTENIAVTGIQSSEHPVRS